MFVNSFTDVFL